MKMTCKNCYQEGHNKRGCKNPTAAPPPKQPGTRGRGRPRLQCETSNVQRVRDTLAMLDNSGIAPAKRKYIRKKTTAEKAMSGVQVGEVSTPKRKKRRLFRKPIAVLNEGPSQQVQGGREGAFGGNGGDGEIGSSANTLTPSNQANAPKKNKGKQVKSRYMDVHNKSKQTKVKLSKFPFQHYSL